jgi:hypothetical protein
LDGEAAPQDGVASAHSSASAKPPPIPLVDLNLIVRYLPRLNDLKEHLTERMEAQIFEGLSTLVRPTPLDCHPRFGLGTDHPTEPLL